MTRLSLKVTDSQASWAGTLRLIADSAGSVELLSEHGTEPLNQWLRTTDPPRFEKQSDGLSIRIGFKRFIISPEESQPNIDSWLSCAAGTENTNADADAPNLKERVTKYTEMLSQGMIDDAEFAVLVQQAAGGSVANTSDNQNEKLELEKRLNLAEYQRLWLSIFEGGMPSTLNSGPLISRISQLRRELQDLPRSPVALTTLTAKTFDLNLLAMGQIGNEIARAVRKGKPLPEMAQRAINQLRNDMNSLLRPMRDFAQRMGWGEIPTL